MSRTGEFRFEDQAMPRAYDAQMVPILFEPWAVRMADAMGDVVGASVLDVATGTGAVARLLAQRVGPHGRVVGADASAAMLAIARECGAGLAGLEWIESPAAPLAVASESFDWVTCQQGMQFFPDRAAAAREMRRVLRPGGRVIATVWCPLVESGAWHAVALGLEDAGETELAAMQHLPFDFLPREELVAAFDSAGFHDVAVAREEAPLVFANGVAQVLAALEATPLRPKLQALTTERRAEVDAAIARRLAPFVQGDEVRGTMATFVLTATRPG